MNKRKLLCSLVALAMLSMIVSPAFAGGPAPIPVGKCDWLPPSPQVAPGEIQAMVSSWIQDATGGHVPVERIVILKEQCFAGEVYSGVVVAGPENGYTSVFSTTVLYQGEVVDVYPGAVVHGSTERLSDETIRVTGEGSFVNAVRATIWFYDDEDPPLGEPFGK